MPLLRENCCTEDQAPVASWGAAAGARHGRVGYTMGIEPEPRAKLPGYDDGVVAMMMAVFVILALSASRHSNFLRTFASSLISGPKRTETFDDHTVAESRITAALLILCCVCEGILIYFAAPDILQGLATPLAIALAAGAAGLLMVLQSGAYALTGFAFASHPSDTRLWLRGFYASQSLLGLALTLPAMALLFYPGAVGEALMTGATLYLLARLLFFIKGFRFFYTNFCSLFFFILYLCTLEIAPLLAMARLGAL